MENGKTVEMRATWKSIVGIKRKKKNIPWTMFLGSIFCAFFNVY